MTANDIDLEKEYSEKLKSLNTYSDINEYMEELNVERREIVSQMRVADHSEMEELHMRKYANFCASREAKHKKVAIFKSTHKRPKF